MNGALIANQRHRVNKLFKLQTVNKMKYIKSKIGLIIAFLGSIFTLQAQQGTTPLKSISELDEDFILDNNLYVKDINNELDQFLGTWKGSVNNKNYEFKIEKHIDNANIFEFKIDVLVIRYVVKENNETIINTLSLPINSNSIIYGLDYKSPDGYRFSYTGDDFDCGQSGQVAIRKIDENSMKLILLPDHILLRTDLCPDGYTTHVLPVSSIVLNKQ